MLWEVKPGDMLFYEADNQLHRVIRTTPKMLVLDTLRGPLQVYKKNGRIQGERRQGKVRAPTRLDVLRDALEVRARHLARSLYDLESLDLPMQSLHLKAVSTPEQSRELERCVNEVVKRTELYTETLRMWRIEKERQANAEVQAKAGRDRS